MADQRTRIVAGCMTGTSLDGLDVALVKVIGTGLDMRAELLGHHALPMPDDLRAVLMSLASGEAREPIVYLRAARALGELHADGLEQLLAGGLVPPNDTQQIDFVTAHGQTIWHAPAPGSGANDRDARPAGMSWQLFDPWPIVRRLKLPVCYDLRQADLIAGGEGAPLTPIADWVMYRDNTDWVVNLGGIMNLTWLKCESQKVKAGDVGPCNLVLDGLCQRLFNRRYDENGNLALAGVCDPVVQGACGDLFYGDDRERSLGREQFDHKWLDEFVRIATPLAEPSSILRTVCNMIALSIEGETAVLPFQRKPKIVLAGGGARNGALTRQIDEVVHGQVILSDDLGIPCEAREAMGFAVLGALSQDGVPISLPQVTGAKDPGVAGVWAGV